MSQDTKPLADRLPLHLLRCPATAQRLLAADAADVAAFNAAILRRSLRNCSGSLVQTPMDAALVTADGALFYPIVAGVPILMPDQALVARRRSA